MNVSFAVFVTGFMVLLGWIMFLVFGGFGLFGIPLDYIYSFVYRPQKVLCISDLEIINNKITFRETGKKSLRRKRHSVKNYKICLSKEMKSNVFQHLERATKSIIWLK